MSSRSQDPAAPDGASASPSPPSGGRSAPPSGQDPDAASSEQEQTGAPPTSASVPLQKLAVDDTDQLLQVADRVGQLHERIVTQTQAEVNGLFELLGSKRRLLLVNFMAGLARGAGFFLGVTLIGGLLIGGMAFFVDTTMAAVGQEDITFRSILKTFAQEAIAAKQMWEEVNQEVTATEPAAESDAAEGVQSPPAPREDG